MTVHAKSRRKSRSPNEVDVRFGIKLRELRVERDLTLQSLAEAVGVSHQQLQKYETGSNRLSVGMLPVVADALGVAVVELLDFSGPAASEQTTRADRLREEAMSVIRRTKSEDTLRTMARVLKALAP